MCSDWEHEVNDHRAGTEGNEDYQQKKVKTKIDICTRQSSPFVTLKWLTRVFGLVFSQLPTRHRTSDIEVRQRLLDLR